MPDPKQIKLELAVFACFLEAHPSFAGEVECYGPGTKDKEIADIAAKLKTGGCISFQLGRWLHEPQMEEAKRKEKQRTKLHGALLPCLEYKPRNFAHVAVAIGDANFDHRDGDALRGEFLRIVSDVEAGWHKERLRQVYGYPLTGFAGYPTVGKYIRTHHFWPQHSPSEGVLSEALGLQAVDGRRADPWIVFTLKEGSSYSSELALQALDKIITKKTTKYDRHQTGDLRLIIYYDEAVLYNTPYEDQRHETFADMAHQARQFLMGKDVRPFGKIYLLRALRPDPEAFEIWPTVGQCR
ncbi:MAG TPA: hypothetical protein VGY99_06220 [Candidatus Binataceae bacterium]|nr:hypothetical protein [Candidatus Binataceae bacterium]